MERLQKIIAKAGLCSRRKAEELIASGKVKVNGVTVDELGSQAELFDKIEVDGVLLDLEEKVYYALNKPAGYITTAKDTHDRKTVLDLVDDINERVFPVGRLDKDTTGLLILTNDGEFANHLIHPRYGMTKEYIAVIKPLLNGLDLKKLEDGIELDDGFAKAIETKIISKNASNWTISIKISIGRKHIVKRMVKYLGSEVIKLHRQSIGSLSVDGIKEGCYRKLNKEEIERLRK